MAQEELLTPKDAAQYLREKTGKDIDVNRLGQLRRAGKVKATKLGYNAVVYTRYDLDNADLSLGKVGRKPLKRDEQSNLPNSEYTENEAHASSAAQQNAI